MITLLPPKACWRCGVFKLSKWNEFQIKIAKHCLILSNWTCHETFFTATWNSRQWFSFVVKQGFLFGNWQFWQYAITVKIICFHENNPRDYWQNVHSLFYLTFQKTTLFSCSQSFFPVSLEHTVGQATCKVGNTKRLHTTYQYFYRQSLLSLLQTYCFTLFRSWCLSELLGQVVTHSFTC